MLILPPGHAESQRRAFTRREWRFMLAAVAVIAVAAVVVVVAIGSSSSKPGQGCINVTVPSTTGGAAISGCGATARAICRDAGVPGHFQPAVAKLISAECRRAKLPAS